MPAAADELAVPRQTLAPSLCGQGQGVAVLADALPGLRELWAETLGDPAICVAVLDGPVDLSHPGLRGARLTQLETPASAGRGNDAATRHGTHVASEIFGRHDGTTPGIAPVCRGVSIPIFEADGAGGFRLCSQVDLARALGLALQHGANVINISGGEFSPSGRAYPVLESAIRACTRAGALIVAAAGNDGCDCLHVPAAVDSVLAVGAMDAAGNALDFGNWGERYRTQGILAPAQDLRGAEPGGGVALGTGTSYATPLVSGVVALFLSLLLKRGHVPDPARVRAALLESALGCGHDPAPDCRRLLAGRLNVRGAFTLLTRSTSPMEPSHVDNGTVLAPESPAVAAVRVETPPAPGPVATPQPKKSGCSCGGAAGPQLVYALGQLGYDLVSEARRDSLAQSMASRDDRAPRRELPHDPDQLLAHLDDNPWAAAAVEWTLNLDGTPVYAVRPQGPFAGEVYKQLREFLKDQQNGTVERISIPGVTAGRATLFNGQVVPVLVPELRGMYSWNSRALVEAVAGDRPAKDADGEEAVRHQKRSRGVRGFLDRVYHELRNVGVSPQDRAINFAATNAYEIDQIYQQAIAEGLELDTIDASPSPISRPGSDCWDVQVYFFYPERQVQTVRKVYRFTVDVSDVVPVTVGPTRAWFTR